MGEATHSALALLAAEPETGIITEEALTEAAGTENTDPSVAENLLDADEGDIWWRS